MIRHDINDITYLLQHFIKFPTYHSAHILLWSEHKWRPFADFVACACKLHP